MIRNEHLAVLQTNGLTPKEARAYIALVELGRGSAATVARKADLRPPTAYVVLKDLINKGFVQRVPRAKKHLFVPEEPTTTLARIEARALEFRALLPMLNTLSGGSTIGHGKTMFFESVAGIKKCYAHRADDLRDCEYVGFFAFAENLPPELVEVIVDWNRKMARANVSSRAIVPSHSSLSFWRKTDKEFKREIKIVPSGSYDAKSSIEIFPNFVRIVMFNSLQAIVIDDPEVASSFKQIFELVWGSR